VYYFGSLAGKRRGLKFDPELLYIAAMFHDMGLTPQHSSKSDRFEVDGANTARTFLRRHNISEPDREAIVAAYPRSAHFKDDIIQTFYDGIEHKPEITFGNVKADVLADKDPKFRRINFCDVIRGSQWKG
jgi:HD superfamily phosphodiesterase